MHMIKIKDDDTYLGHFHFSLSLLQVNNSSFYFYFLTPFFFYYRKIIKNDWEFHSQSRSRCDRLTSSCVDHIILFLKSLKKFVLSIFANKGTSRLWKRIPYNMTLFYASYVHFYGDTWITGPFKVIDRGSLRKSGYNLILVVYI
jgi:hypothetical protein